MINYSQLTSITPIATNFYEVATLKISKGYLEKIQTF